MSDMVRVFPEIDWLMIRQYQELSLEMTLAWARGVLDPLLLKPWWLRKPGFDEA